MPPWLQLNDLHSATNTMIKLAGVDPLKLHVDLNRERTIVPGSSHIREPNAKLVNKTKKNVALDPMPLWNKYLSPLELSAQLVKQAGRHA